MHQGNRNLAIALGSLALLMIIAAAVSLIDGSKKLGAADGSTELRDAEGSTGPITQKRTIETRPNDLKGWANTRWGMSQAELMKSLSSPANFVDVKNVSLQPTGQRWFEPLSTHVTDLGNGLNGDANFYFRRDSKRLDAVYVVVDKDSSNMDPAHKRSFFEQIVERVSESYGTPDVTRDRSNESFANLDAIWKFHSSAVVANYLDTAPSDTSYSSPVFSITYYSPDAFKNSEQLTVTNDSSADSTARPPKATEIRVGKVPPFRIFLTEGSWTSFVVSPKTTDYELKSLMLFFHQKVQSAQFDAIGIPSPERGSEGVINIYKGARCAGENFSDYPSDPSCFGKNSDGHEAAIYQWKIAAPAEDYGEIFPPKGGVIVVFDDR